MPAAVDTKPIASPQLTPVRPRGRGRGYLFWIGITLAAIGIGISALLVIAVTRWMATPEGNATVTAIMAKRSTRVAQSTITARMTAEELKATAKTVSYDELARNTETYVGDFLYYKGKVIQIIEGYGQQVDLRVNVTKSEYGSWDDTVYVHYTGPRLLENDIIDFYGTVDGRYTYETVLHTQVTIPEITVVALSLDK